MLTLLAEHGVERHNAADVLSAVLQGPRGAYVARVLGELRREMHVAGDEVHGGLVGLEERHLLIGDGDLRLGAVARAQRALKITEGDLADMRLGEGVDGVDAGDHCGLHVLDGGNELREHLDVHGAVGEKVAKLEVLELGACRVDGVDAGDHCGLHVLDGGNELREHLDVHGAVGEKVAKLEVLELGACR